MNTGAMSNLPMQLTSALGRPDRLPRMLAADWHVRADTLRASARMRRSLRSQPGSATRFAPPNQAASPATAAVKPSARRPPRR